MGARTEQKSHWGRMTTEQKCSLIREVWSPEYSARDVASLVSRKVGHHVTKGSMIGLQNRHFNSFLRGIAFSGSTKTVERAPRKPRAFAEKLFRPLVEREFYWSPTVTDEARFVPLHGLEARECRYPVNNASMGEEHLFCGCKTKVGEVYCDTHRAVTGGGKQVARSTPSLLQTIHL